MNTPILIGAVAFGGIVLLTTLMFTGAEPEDPSPLPGETLTVLPDEVTDGFPTYPDTQVINSLRTVGNDGRVAYSFSLESDDSITEINDWYRTALNNDGWSIKSDRNVAGYQIIQGEKDTLFTSMQAANGEAGSVTISQQAQIRP